jgi:hypothetical protein
LATTPEAEQTRSVQRHERERSDRGDREEAHGLILFGDIWATTTTITTTLLCVMMSATLGAWSTMKQQEQQQKQNKILFVLGVFGVGYVLLFFLHEWQKATTTLQL